MKKQADEKHERNVKAFLKEFDYGVAALTKVFSMITSRSVNPLKDANTFLGSVDALWMLMSNAGSSLKIDPTRPDVRAGIQKLTDLKNQAIEFRVPLLERDKAAKALEKDEGVEKLAPMKMESLTKDEIENKLFKLHADKGKAVSKTEKDEIQKKIDELVKIYKEGE